MNSKLIIKSINIRFLSGILALFFLLTISLSVTALPKENQDGEQNVLRQTSLHFMQVGEQQYRRNLFNKAEQSFRRACIFQNYLTAAEREQLNELLENTRIAISNKRKGAVTETKSADESFKPHKSVKTEAIVEKAKESELSTEKERKQIKEEPAPMTNKGEQTEERAKTEAQLQTQAQIYTALEEQLKAEMQAQSKSQQEAEVQTKLLAIIEAEVQKTIIAAKADANAEVESYTVTIDQSTQNKINELIGLLRSIDPNDRNSAIVESEQTDGSEVPSLINPSIPKEKTIDLGNGITMEFVLIPAGEFDMGSPVTERDRENDEGPVHRIEISRPFYIGKYEVTQEQYLAVAKYKPSQFKQESRPVERVSWDQADRFCRKLSEVKDRSYRLPTEAEWEYACRAGSQDRFCFGHDPAYSQIEQYAWCSENSNSATHPVGEKKPNSFGLYDMHGNVSEWCGDWYTNDYYYDSKTVDPLGPEKGKSRIHRGGSWFHDAKYCRSANRSNCEPYYIRNYVGFRIVLEVE